MALQHHEFQLCPRDTEKLQLYVKSGLSDQKSLYTSLKETQLNVRHWELEAKEATNKAARAEAERDAARHEAAMARLEADAAGSARAQMESELTRVQGALTTLEGVKLKAKSELNFF